MSNIIKKAAMGQANKHLKKQAGIFAPEDPLYEERTDEQGRVKRVKRDLPLGLTKKEEKVLKKVKRRARRLDKGMSICGFRVGYTFFLSLVPVVGDVADMCLNYFCVVRIAKRVDLPPDVLRKMLANNAVSASFSFIPVAGDIFLGVWKANSRNSKLLENHLAERGRKRLAEAEEESTSAAPNVAPATKASPKVQQTSQKARAAGQQQAHAQKPKPPTQTTAPPSEKPAPPVARPAVPRGGTQGGGRKWWGGRREKAESLSTV